jgi:3-phenylpropionate/cinnamic acid dioxygenase small subunit
MTATTNDLDSVLRRLAQLEDERAIQQRLYTYGHSIDYGLEADWVDCFTEDGVWDVRQRVKTNHHIYCSGRAELAKYITTHTRAPMKWHKHLLMELKIDLDGDSARVDSYFLRVDQKEGARSEIVAMGRYRDTMVRDADGQWRIKERICEVED